MSFLENLRNWSRRGVARPLVCAGAVLVFCFGAVAQEIPGAPDAVGLQHDMAAAERAVGTIVMPTAAALPPARAGRSLPAKDDITLIGQRKIGKGLDFYSLEREQQLGRELASEVEHGSRLITDKQVTEYVNRIGQNLVRNSDAKVPFTIKVVDNDEINAFALPGGFFYVNSGLILAADNESELAGVMAHEIAHVAARHATKAATKAEIWNVASIPLIFMAGPAGYALRSVSSLLVPMSFLKFSRDAEREADQLGLQYEYATGYDPQSFVAFFERLEAQEKQKHSRLAKAFLTHPMTADRIRRAQDEIAEILPGKDEYVLNTSEFDGVKARLGELTARHEIDNGKGPRPTLRKRTEGTRAGDKPTLNKKGGD